MKAITVRQPWAWAISTGAKNVENRTQSTSYRGPLAIHAGLGWSDRGAEDRRVIDLAWDLSFSRPHASAVETVCPPSSVHALARRRRAFTYGAVIAIAQLVDTHPDTGCCRPWGESAYIGAGGRLRTTIHHLVLDDIRALEVPLPARGALGLWTPDPDLIDALGVAA